MGLSHPQFSITARLAQSVEHETLNLRVVGSSPTLGDQLFFSIFKSTGPEHYLNTFINVLNRKMFEVASPQGASVFGSEVWQNKVWWRRGLVG